MREVEGKAMHRASSPERALHSGVSPGSTQAVNLGTDGQTDRHNSTWALPLPFWEKRGWGADPAGGLGVVLRAVRTEQEGPES